MVIWKNLREEKHILSHSSLKRRNFIRNTALAAGTIPFSGQFVMGQSQAANKPFNLNYAPHIGMFTEHAGEDPIAQLQFMADQGFQAFEDNEMAGRPIDLQKDMAETMSKRGLQMGVFVAHKIYWKEPNLASGDAGKRSEFLEDIKKSVEVAKRVNAKWMTVVPGHVDLQKSKGYQTANVVESLKQASALLEPHDLIMVLEPLNFRDHPGLFLTESPPGI